MIKRLLTALVLMILSASPAEAATTHYNLTLPTVGASTNVWGTQLNTIFNTLDTDLWTVSGGFTIGANTQSSSSNVTLTNPAKNIQLMTFTATGKDLILPAMNATQSPVVGGTPLTVYNAGSNSFSILAQDGTTAIVSGLLTGQFVNLYLTSAGTANGTFVVSGPYSASGVGSGNFTTLAATGATSLSSTLAVTGAATFSSTINKLTITPPASAATLTIASGKTFTASNTLTFTGSDNTSFAFPSTSDTVVTLAASQNLTNKTATTQAVGTSDTTLATTAFVNPASSLAANGWTELPNGLIMEWGNATVSTSGTAVTFAHTLPNALYSVTATNAGGFASVFLTAMSTSGATFEISGGGPNLCYYMVIGK